MSKAQIAGLLARLRDAELMIDPRSDGYDAVKCHEILDQEGVELQTADGLAWVSMSANGFLTGIELRPEALKAGDGTIARSLTTTIREAERIVETAVKTIQEQQRRGGRHGS